MGERIDPDEIRRLRAEADLVSLLVEDGSEPIKEGALTKFECPFHADDKPSLVVYPDGDRGFCCYGCGAAGDAIEYLRKRRKLTFGQAIEALRGGPRMDAPRKIDRRRKENIIFPIPDTAPTHRFHLPGATALGEPTAVWWYGSPTGAKLMAVVRYPVLDEQKQPRMKDGKAEKTIRSWCWARRDDGSEGWACTRPSDHLPLYGLDRLAAQPDRPVILVEGEKTADAHTAHDPSCVTITWPGGSKNVEKADRIDWSPLAGRSVTLVPDHDKSGAWAMRMIAQWLVAAGAMVAGVADLRGRDLPQGWDLADTDQAGAVATVSRIASNVDEALADMVRQFPGELGERLEEKLAKAETLPPGANPPPPTEPPAGSSAEEFDENERGDIANASRFVAMHGRDVRYCPEHERWYVWNGKLWEPDHKKGLLVVRLAKQTALAIAAEHLAAAEDLRQEARELLKDSKDKPAEGKFRQASAVAGKAEKVQSRTKLFDMIHLAQSHLAVLVKAEDLDPAQHLLNTPGGLVDLNNGKVYHHDRKHLCTRITRSTYAPGAAPGDLLKVLASVTGNDAAIAEFLQSTVGRSLFGNNDLEKVYMMQGPGGSGKGTLMEGVKSALGTYCGTAEFQTFVKAENYRIRDDLHRLAPFNLVLASETEKGQQLASAVLKSISGRDTLTTRGLYGEYQESRGRYTIWLQCNDRPRVDDQDSGMWRRLVLIPCGPEIPEERRDPELKNWLIDPERGGKAILAWLIAGAIRTHQAKRIEEPPAVKRASAEYRMSQDPTREYFNIHLRLAAPETRDRCFVKVGDLNHSWKAYCTSEQIPERFRMKPKQVVERLEERFGCVVAQKSIPGANKSYYVITGVTLHPDVPIEEHELRSYTHLPDEAEHARNLGIWKFEKCDGGESPTRTRARAPTSAYLPDSSKNQILKSSNPGDAPDLPLGDA